VLRHGAAPRPERWGWPTAAVFIRPIARQAGNASIASIVSKPSRGAGVLCRRIQVVGRCRCGLVEIQEESLAAIFLSLISQAGFLKKFP
jgi:hypothetical protein